MNSVVAPYTIILASVVLLFQTTPAAAHHLLVLHEGLVPNCKAIDGELQSFPFNTDHTQEIDVCGNDGGFYRVATSTNCPPVDAGNSAQHPTTRKTYFFSWICDTPVTCNPDYSWVESPITTQYYYDRELRVKIGNETHHIVTSAKGSFCTGETFTLNAKKLEIFVYGIKGDNGTVSITFPNKLLGGEFSVKIDDKSAQFGIEQMRNATRIAVELEINDSQALRKIEIIGTQVIPEFGSMTFLVAAGGMAVIIGVIWSLRKRDPYNYSPFAP